jgi:muramoyltetrapeptide carboxypeptidase
LCLHLRLAGVLDKVSGIVIGEFVDVKKDNSDHPSSIEDVLKYYFSDGPPCVYGYSFSHGPYTCPIPIGAKCEMDANTGKVSFRFSMAP